MKSTLKKIIIALFSALCAIEIILCATGNFYLNKALFYNFPNIDDYKIFANRQITSSQNTFTWAENYLDEISDVPELIKDLETTALLVIKNDSIVYEHYAPEYENGELSGSFSVAKSYVSALVGCALADGLIDSINDPLSKYLPEYIFSGADDLTVKSLLTMSSGLSWDESYQGLFSITTKAYYGNNLKVLMQSLKSISPPNQQFKYLSGDTQLLGLLLEKVSGKPLASYLEEKLWHPLGSTQNALWSLDHENGTEKAYCCLNAQARDFARLGVLYLNKGQWQGKEIIPAWYVKESTTPASHLLDQNKMPVNFYGYQWWIISEPERPYTFYARGILGQYIICIPEKNTVIVRLGKQRGEKTGQHHDITYQLIDWAETFDIRR